MHSVFVYGTLKSGFFNHRLLGGCEFFDGAVVSLGALGIVSRVTLDVEPTFDVRQDVFEDLPWSALEEHIADIVSSAYSVSLFTDLQGDTVNELFFFFF